MANQHAVLKHSVTRDDYTTSPRQASVLNFFVGMGMGRGATSLPSSLPPYWSRRRDEVLSATVHYESMWASSVYIAMTRLVSMDFKIRGPRLRAQGLRDLCLASDDGKGWVTFLSKLIRDYLLTDNGAFIEVVRATEASGSKIVGLIHLDSRRCRRTGNPEAPVVYLDKKDRPHELQDYQVIMLSDSPDTSERLFGVGHCAASRAYNAIYTLHALEEYVSQKITGRRPLSLNFVNNVNIAQVEDAVAAADQQASNRGYVSFMGAVVIPQIDLNVTPAVATIQLAGLPEGWTPEEERRKAYLVYANALGVDPQEIDPQLLASRALGTGAQSRVIDDKASGKGQIAFRQDFMQAFNEYISPGETTFTFEERDYRDQLQQATVSQLRTQNIVSMVTTGLILPEQGTQMLVDLEEVPPEFLATADVTPIEEISSNQKPRLSLPAPTGRKPVITANSEAGMQTRDVYSPTSKEIEAFMLNMRWKAYQDANPA